MGEYFTFPYHGQPFVQLGPAHISAVVLIVGVILLLRRFPPRPEKRKIVRLTLAGIILINELFWHAWHAAHGLWSIQELLPLEICNLMVLGSVWVLMTKNQIGYEFIYLLGIPAASQVLITPALGPYGFPHSLFFQIFISHGGIIVAALYLTLVEGMRPVSWKAVGRVAGWTTLYAMLIFFLNRILGSNYLFLAYKPPAATVLDYLGPWPWYILSMEALGLLLAMGMYLPFHFRKSSPAG